MIKDRLRWYEGVSEENVEIGLPVNRGDFSRAMRIRVPMMRQRIFNYKGKLDHGTHEISRILSHVLMRCTSCEKAVRSSLAPRSASSGGLGAFIALSCKAVPVDHQPCSRAGQRYIVHLAQSR